eukprot:1728593-Pleurochrysis_carterae.AAC.4
MGVKNFWPLLSTAAQTVNIRNGDIAGWRVAVDVSVLLHGAVGQGSIAMQQIIQGNLAPGDALGQVCDVFEMLHCCGVKAVAFFDGTARPFKSDEVRQRQAMRREAAAEARHLSACADADPRAIMKAAQKAAHVTGELRAACIKHLKRQGVAIVGAPFEADGQMAWAYKQGTVDAVLTNDSDLCVLGCKVLRIPAGRAIAWMHDESISLYDIPAMASAALNGTLQYQPPTKPDLAFCISMYGQEVLLFWAMLNGCDYDGGKGVRGVGVVAAYAIIQAMGSSGPQRKLAVSWQASDLHAAVCAVKPSALSQLPSATGQWLQQMRNAFFRQPILGDSIAGQVCALSGEAWATLSEAEIEERNLPASTELLGWYQGLSVAPPPLQGQAAAASVSGAYDAGSPSQVTPHTPKSRTPVSRTTPKIRVPMSHITPPSRSTNPPSQSAERRACHSRAACCDRSNTSSPPLASPLQLRDADVGVDNLYEEPNENVVAELQRWLQSRNLPSSSMRKEDLVSLVKSIRAQDRIYGIMHVRDPQNRISLGHQLIATGIPPEEFPQFDEALQPPASDPVNWISEPNAICRTSPLLSEGVIHAWARKEKLIYTIDGVVFYGESFKRGASRSLNNPDLNFSVTKPYQDHLGRQVHKPAEPHTKHAYHVQGACCTPH